FCYEADSWLVLRVCKASDIPNALRDVRHGILPIALVLDGDVPAELLSAQLAQDAFHVGDAQAERQVGRIGVAGLNDVLQMHADDAALENFETGDRIDAGTGPVPYIGTDAETRIAILDQREDVVGIPEFAVGFVRALRMTVNARG